VRLLPHPSFVIFNTKPPDDVFMKFYVFDEKTVMEIPFEVHDIPLMYSFERSTPEKPPVSEVIYTRRDALRLKFMIEKLGLDAAQRAEIEEIQKLSRLEMSRLLSRFQWNESTYLKWSEGKAAAIDAVLNPDQRKTLKSLDPFATAPRVEPSGPLNVHGEPAKPRRGLGGLEKP